MKICLVGFIAAALPVLTASWPLHADTRDGRAGELAANHERTRSSAALDPATASAILAALPASIDGSLARSALAFDTTFGVNGHPVYDFNGALGVGDNGLRVFPAAGGGYWLVGEQLPSVPSNKPAIAIIKLGNDGGYVPGYGVNGEIVLTSALDTITDVAIGAADRLYFAGNRELDGDSDFGVQCIDASGAYCAGFGNSNSGVALSTAVFQRGASNNDFADTIAFDFSYGVVYVVGRVDTGSGSTSNYAIGAAAWDGVSGELDEQFSDGAGQPGRVTHNIDFAPNAIDRPYQVQVAYYGQSDDRLVIVGSTSVTSSTNDYDAFVMELADNDGSLASDFGTNGLLRVFFDLSATDKFDAFSAVTITADGGLLVAGTSRNDQGGGTVYNELTLARFDVFGNAVTRFGDGGRAHGLVVSGYQYPSAIAERPGNHDFVVAMTVHDDLGGHPEESLQAFVEYPPRPTDVSSFRALNAATYTAADGITPQAYTSGMLVDAQNGVLVAGSRLWNTANGDYDMTLARMLDTDTIFVDGYEP